MRHERVLGATNLKNSGYKYVMPSWSMDTSIIKLYMRKMKLQEYNG